MIEEFQANELLAHTAKISGHEKNQCSKISGRSKD
jgi:hypothetical protein